MYAQALMAISFAVAAYQDVRERAVSDLVWIPALVGFGYVLYSFYTGALPGYEYYFAKLAMLGGIALVFTYLGHVGEADGIAIAFVAADPFVLSPILPLLGAAVVALGHIGYEFGRGNARGTKTIPMPQFLKEKRWIPKAMVSEGTRTEVSGDVNMAREEVEAAKRPDALVEVRYGVPTVAYLGLGYIAYVVYLVAFSFAAFALAA